MKTFIKISFTVLALFITFGCKNDKKEEQSSSQEKTTLHYQVVGENSMVKWIAYKTTEKMPVKGEFKSIKITKSKSAPTINDAIDGVQFSIPVSSLFTNEPTRDSKLKEFFFGVMDNTEFISGEFSITDTQSSVSITMNGVTKAIPIDLTIEGQTASFSTTIDLNDWNLKDAVESINKACYDLHKGPDGVSKTWEEAEIKGVINLVTTM